MTMNNDVNEFERAARERWEIEMARMPVPNRRLMRSVPRATGRSPYLLGTTALLALAALISISLLSRLTIAPNSSQAPGAASPAGGTAGQSPASPTPGPTTLPGVPPLAEEDQLAEPIAWIWQGNTVLIWDRQGRTMPGPYANFYTRIITGLARGDKHPLLLVALNDGQAGLLDYESNVLLPLDLPAESLAEELSLSPDGTQAVLKTQTQNPEKAALIQVDTRTGATWTLIDASAMGEHAAWVRDSSIAQWGWKGIYLDVQSEGGRGILRIQPRASDAAAPAAFEMLIWMPTGGDLSVSPALDSIIYRPSGDTNQHVLDTRSGQEQTYLADDLARLVISPDGLSIAMIQAVGEGKYRLLFQSTKDGSSRVVATFSADLALNAALEWSVDGRYLSVISASSPSDIQVFDSLGGNHNLDQPFPLVAKYRLPGTIKNAMVQEIHDGDKLHVNVLTVSVVDDRYELTIYNPDSKTQQAFDLGDEGSTLIYLPQ
jgi:hypothetical protein